MSIIHESVLSIIDGLSKVNEQQDIAFNEKTYATLTKEDKEILHNNGFATIEISPMKK